MVNYLIRRFRLEDSGSSIKTEIIAGTTTFLTAAYIIFVHPSMLAATGMERGALTSVTCLAAALATLLVALVCNAPIMMAPGMGLNAFFTYTLVLGQGVPWQTALGVVFISGVLFLLLSLLGVREHLVRAIPPSLQAATAVGIGLFIAFIGMRNMGLVVDSPATLVRLGAVTPQVAIGLAGLLVMLVLQIKQVRGAILIGIAVSTLLAIATGFTPLPDSVVALPPSVLPLLFKLDITSALTISLWSSIFSFMFVDLFDSLGSLVAVCREAGMVEDDGDIPAISPLLTVDALATIGGALLGTSTTTAFIESGSGVAAGGRSGLSSVVTALWFVAALFFAPVIAIVPAYATAPALIVVGLFMLGNITVIDFSDFAIAAPAFLTIIMMPLSYSIATGLAFGFSSYVLIQLFLGRIRHCHPLLIAAACASVASLL